MDEEEEREREKKFMSGYTYINKDGKLMMFRIGGNPEDLNDYREPTKSEIDWYTDRHSGKKREDNVEDDPYLGILLPQYRGLDDDEKAQRGIPKAFLKEAIRKPTDFRLFGDVHIEVIADKDGVKIEKVFDKTTDDFISFEDFVRKRKEFEWKDYPPLYRDDARVIKEKQRNEEIQEQEKERLIREEERKRREGERQRRQEEKEKEQLQILLEKDRVRKEKEEKERVRKENEELEKLRRKIEKDPYEWYIKKTLKL